MKRQNFDRVVALADDYVANESPKMKWTWGEALLGYALLELDCLLGEDRYTPFLKSYCDYYMEQNPSVNSSDTSAPALITYGMQKKYPNNGYEKLTNKVLNYIKHEPRVLGDAVNHLGNSPVGKLYPKSIWVDSLMMFGVFPARYGTEQNDENLVNFAAKKPRFYAGYMQDAKKKLWYHSYWVKKAKHYPEKEIFWGRGNGWVVASLPMILEYIPKHHPEYSDIIRTLETTSKALRPLQRDDGYWDTILDTTVKNYRESSVTALIASGWLRAIRKGYLCEEYLEPALKAFYAVVDNLEEKNGRICLAEISGPTIPLQVFPLLGYKLVPKGENWSYGIAALIFAAIEYRKIDEKGS